MVDTDKCWLWAGYQNRLGYGMYQIKIDGKWRERRAHRLMYEAEKGTIPEGLVLDHLCRVPTCINPDHLEPVSVAENVLRGEAVKLQRSKTHCPHGHEYTEENTRRHKVGKYVFRLCKACLRISRRKYYLALKERTQHSSVPKVKTTK